MKKPNVLFVNHSVRDGGPGRSLFYILKHIDRRKVNPFVLVPRHDVFSEELKAAGIFENVIVDPRFPENIRKPVTGPGSGAGPSGPLSGPATLFFALLNVVRMTGLVLDSPRLVRENAIDVIYCNGTLAKIVGALVGKRTARPVVWHVRNIQRRGFMKFLMKTLSGFRCVRRIICVSNATASQFGHVGEKVRVVYNGIDPADFDAESVRGSLREEFSIPDDAVVVGSTGRIVPRKGYADFLRVARSVVSELGPGTEVRFVVVGDTPHFFPKDHLRELRELAEELGLGENFVFTGYRKDVRPYLADFDVFAIPSNYPDPFPRSVIEAMASGLPVVGFSAGGVAEAVEHEKTGFLCPGGDFRAMKESLETLVKDPDRRRGMGAASRRRVAEMCSAAERTADIQEIILSLR